jgi:hypothetical protein
MLNVCVNCGIYRADKTIDPIGPYAICPACEHKQKFQYMPLWIVSGASGSGKSTVCQYLTGQFDKVVMLDSDILWREQFDNPETNYKDFFETWLRMCKNITQSSRPVVLFGSGIGVPENLENCVERRYFSRIYYLALTCTKDALTKRLENRPKWRNSHQLDFIAEQNRFNEWFMNYNKKNLRPEIRLVDTTYRLLKETSDDIISWICENLTAC